MKISMYSEVPTEEVIWELGLECEMDRNVTVTSYLMFSHGKPNWMWPSLFSGGLSQMILERGRIDVS